MPCKNAKILFNSLLQAAQNLHCSGLLILTHHFQYDVSKSVMMKIQEIPLVHNMLFSPIGLEIYAVRSCITN